MTRVLLTTVDQDFGLYDYYRENAPAGFRWRFQMPRRISFGLRFLRQNIPDIEILEYPTRAEYRNALKKGWDVVGYSFYLEESNYILQMAEEARASGVKKLWAGNYGALTPSVQASFDDVFSGCSEDAVAQNLGKTLGAVRHPPLVSEFRLPGGWPMPIGILFTTRGCSFPCTFCQTTAFAPRPKAIPLESIEEAIRFYVAHGIQYVLILHEDLRPLAAMELDVTQITIVTPHPRTQLWNELDTQYGIFEKDLSKYDTKHLVWSHPNCKPGVLESLLKEGFQKCYGKDWLGRTGKKFLKSRLRQHDLTNLLLSPLHARWAEPKRLPYLDKVAH